VKILTARDCKKRLQRVAQALSFLTRGYAMDPAKVINDALFTEDYEEMIVQKDIDFYSLCEHHLLPFFRQGSRRLYSPP
jgi:GTP cyclohydrolase I